MFVSLALGSKKLLLHCVEGSRSAAGRPRLFQTCHVWLLSGVIVLVGRLALSNWNCQSLLFRLVRKIWLPAWSKAAPMIFVAGSVSLVGSPRRLQSWRMTSRAALVTEMFRPSASKPARLVRLSGSTRVVFLPAGSKPNEETF